MKTARIAPIAALLLAAACGGSGPSAPSFAVGGTVGGLAGAAGVTLRLDGPTGPLQNLAVAADGAFQFTPRLPAGAAWTVTALPSSTVPRQTCLVAPGSGVIGAADAVVTVTCTTDTFQVGGTVTNLAAGSSVTLRNSGGDELVVASAGASTPFTFASPVPSGGAFAVTVWQQPVGPSQTCQVAGGAGTVAAAAVTSVVVACEPNDKPVAGRLDGLAGATGVVLQVNLAFDTPLTANGDFAVLTNLRTGDAWTLRVRTQPTQPWQTCTVAGGAGVMSPGGAGGAVVTCQTDAFRVGGTVSGVLLPGLTLSLDDGTPLAVDGDGSFEFPGPVASGQPYLVKVVDQPPSQACAVTGGSGEVGGAAVADVTVTCGCAGTLGNCNAIASDGCETETLLAVDHCGACGHACAFPNGLATCSAGACQLGGCLGGFQDCGGGAADGCETDVQTDPGHCGSCARACSFPNGVAACAAGGCLLAACGAGFGDCTGGAADGCETDLRSSVAHCGGCNQPCLLDHATPACVASACAVAACAQGFGDCDGQAGTGCERDLTGDPFNCGACNRSCSTPNAASTCSASTCGMGACDPGWSDCNADPADGCESQASSDPGNCGGCGTVCSGLHGTPACTVNTCSMSACDAGWGDCQGNAAAGCETDLTGSQAHCGSCGAACAADQACAASRCIPLASCRAIREAVPSVFGADGPYLIDPDGAGPGAPVEVWCDMTTDGGGWTFFAFTSTDFQAGLLFEQDLGTYDPARGALGGSYGLGGSVYQPALPTQLMVTLDLVDTLAARNADRFVVYEFPFGSPAFMRGPSPTSGGSTFFKFRTHFDNPRDGIFDSLCEGTNLWCPHTADLFDGTLVPVSPLTLLNGDDTAGLYWGRGLAPPGTPGVDTFQHPGWWYFR